MPKETKSKEQYVKDHFDDLNVKQAYPRGPDRTAALERNYDLLHQEPDEPAAEPLTLAKGKGQAKKAEPVTEPDRKPVATDDQTSDDDDGADDTSDED